MIPDAWRFAAREVVAGWPPLTKQDNQEITAIAVAHHRRTAREDRDEVMAA